jgi:hypothetical protein
MNFSNLDPKQAELLVLTQVRKNLGDSQALQRLGFEVNVQIFRLPDNAGKLLKSNPERLDSQKLKQVMADHAQPVYQLRASQELKAQTATASVPVELQPETFEANMRKNYMYPKGGYTKVELKDPTTGETVVGECHFGIDEIFNRKLANSRAFGKLFSRMLKKSTMGVKRGKQVIKELV